MSPAPLGAPATPRAAALLRLWSLALPIVLATFGAVATGRAWPARLPLHLALFVVAGAAWTLALALLHRVPRARYDLVVLVAVALLLRVPAWLSAPAHSDDVYRFAWDARVGAAAINPYRYAPADPALASLRDGGDERPEDHPTWERDPPSAWSRLHAAPGIWSHINHRDLPTLYPPGAQLLFRAAATLAKPWPGHELGAVRALVALADLGVLGLLIVLLRRRGIDPRWAAAWGWSPLVVIEAGQNGHLEPVPILGVVAALVAWQSGGLVRAGLCLGMATATKLVTAPLFLIFRAPRAVFAGVAICACAALPYASAGSAIAGSTGEFARRWRANAGLYALVQAGTDRLVCAALDAPRVERADGPQCDKPLDLWPNWTLARVITGRSYRAAVYPDELSGFVGRGVAAAMMAMVMLAAAWRTRASRPGAAASLSMDEGVEWVLGALLLLTPALHPWYALWLLPSVALGRRAAWVALAALVPLGYVPLVGWLAGGAWHDPIWTRTVEQGACLLLLVGGVRLAAGELRSASKLDRSVEPDTILPGAAAPTPAPHPRAQEIPHRPLRTTSRP